MMTTGWLVQRVNPPTLKKLPRVKLTLVPRKVTPRLMLMPKELRCEGVEIIDLGRVSVKTF
jgi:hypothetical protein